MPRRTHPSKSSVPDRIKPSHASLKSNADANAHQVSKTVMLDSKDNGVPLGKEGQMKAFGKLQVSIKKIPEQGSEEANAATNFALPSSLLFKNQQEMENNPTLGGDRGLLTRAVGAYQVDSMLGLNSLAEEKFGQTKDGKLMGVSVQVDGSPVSKIVGMKQHVLDIDYSDPRIQRGLSDLEVSDYITGQIDRHLGNVYVDPTTGRVTGIDNDLCLPESPRSVVMQDSLAHMKSIVTMPLTMHEDTAKKLLDADPEALREKLRATRTKGAQPLSEDAIEGAVTRLKELQNELGKGQQSSIKVVSKFDQNTYDEALRVQEESFGKETKGMTFDQAEQHFKTTGIRNAIGDLKRCVRTSMLGKVAIELRLAGVEPDDNVLHQDGAPAPKRSQAELAEGKAYQRMPRDEQKAFDKEFEKLARKEKLLEKREERAKKLDTKPSLLDKIRAIPEGGVKAASRHDKKRVERLTDEIAELNKSLDTKLNAYKVNQTVGLEVHGQTNEVNRGQRNSTELRSSLSNSQSMDNSQEENSLKESKGKGKELLESQDGNNNEVRESTKVKVPQVQEKETLPEVDLGVTNLDTGNDTKPGLTKQDSVRDLLKKTGAVQAAKQKLGLTEGSVLNPGNVKMPPRGRK